LKFLIELWLCLASDESTVIQPRQKWKTFPVTFAFEPSNHWLATGSSSCPSLVKLKCSLWHSCIISIKNVWAFLICSSELLSTKNWMSTWLLHKPSIFNTGVELSFLDYNYKVNHKWSVLVSWLLQVTSTTPPISSWIFFLLCIFQFIVGFLKHISVHQVFNIVLLHLLFSFSSLFLKFVLRFAAACFFY
jgi:hypothetical protein